ncbi:MAG: quinohemoprotein amine dehydrogenase subunit gamma [Vicinamibacterales bacterium]
MKHLKSINQKAVRLERHVTHTAASLGTPAASPEQDVVALQRGGPPQQPNATPHIPLGCSLVFSPGWEADRTGGTAGLCQPVERDLFDCHIGCYWPAQVPDQLNHAPDWTNKCAAAQKDWRKIDLVFP